MPKFAPMEVLTQREYLTPGECGRVFGRSASFWSAALDAGDVEGYTDGPRSDRRILAGRIDPATGEATPGSARAILRSIGKQKRPTQKTSARANVKLVLRDFRERLRTQACEGTG